MHKPLAVLLLLTATARADEQTEADATDAARLLFGVGLQIDADETTGKVHVAYAPGSKLDADRTKMLIDTYLAPQVERQRTGYSFNADYQVFLVDYRGAARAGGDAWVMMESLPKRQMCINLAEEFVPDEKRQKDLVDWCWFTAARLARHSLHDFNGVPADSSADTVYNGTLGVGDKLFSAAKYTLIVPGVSGRSSAQAMRVQENLLKYIPEDNQYYGEAGKLRQANAAWIKKQQAAVAALDSRLGGSGGKVIWGTRFFGPWDPVEPVASVDSCKGVYWKAFGPAKVAGGAVFVWEMSVDGSVCQTDFIQDRRIAAGGPFYTGAAGDCSAPLVTPGKHKVEVALYATRDQKTGRKNVDFGSDRITISNEIRSAKTKVVASGSLSCTSPEGLRVVAAE